MTAGPLQGSWLSRLRPEPAEPVGRVVVAPHSGAGPNTLLPLVRLLPERLDVLGVTLPGRERRFAEDPEVGADELVTGVLDELAGLAPLRTVLFGHSLGGSVAVALAQAGPGVCSAVVVSAQLPGGSRIERPAEWGDAALLEVMELGGGTPADLLADPGFRAHMLRVLRADLALGGRLARRNATGGIPVPLTVLGGSEDLLVPSELLAEWRGQTDPEPRVRIFPGGHFYLLDEANGAAVAAEISAAGEFAAVS